MANGSGITMNAVEIDSRLQKIRKKYPEKFGEAFTEVAPFILRDAIMEEPRAPHKTGNLWRSQKILVPRVTAALIELEFGFNANYAAYVHEMPADNNWTLEGSGPKFLESKLSKHAAKYYGLITAKAKAKAGM